MPQVELLPFPVAHPLSYARDESLYVTKRVDNTQFAAYQAIRTTALLLLADYLEGETSCRAVGDAILGLRLPHWKEWVDLCTSLAKYWRGDYPTARPERESRFPSLVEGWLEGAFARNARKLPKWEGLLRGLPGGQGPARNAIDAFWTVRNRRAHAEGTKTDDDSREQELLRTLQPLLDAMLDSLFPEGSVQLLRVISEEDPRVIRLHGPHRDLRFEAETLGPEWAGVFSNSSVVAIAEDEAVGIHPLFLAFDPETAAGVGGSGGLIEDLYLIDGLSERKVVGLGVLNWKNLSDPLSREVRARFAARQVEFGLIRQQTKPWTLADWTAARSSRRLADMTGRKYFPAFYLERRGVDDFLRVSLAIDVPSGARPSPKGRALLLLGEAGAGKSSILARLVERLLPVAEEAAPVEAGRRLESYEEKRGSRDVVIFLSGADAYPRDRSLPADQLLSEAVTRQGEVKRGEFGSLADFCQELSKSVEEDRQKGRKVWIILDAINEADRFTDLVEALDSFLPEVEQYPWLRLVVSMRSGAYHSLARRDESAFSHGPVVFRNARVWQQFSKASMGPGGEERTGPRGLTDRETVPYLNLRPFQLGTEGKESYGLRQRAPGMRTCPARWDSLDRAMRELLLSPLHLHLFHETFHAEQNVPAALSETKLLNAYLDQLEERMPGLPRRLLQLGEVMRETRRALLPLELAEAWVKEWRGGTHGAAESLAKLDPVEELVSASVLMRPVEEGEGLARRKVGYSFSHQKLAEAVLVREIEARLIRETGTAIPTPEGLLELAKEAAGASEPSEEMVGAVSSLVVKAVERGDGRSVAAVLDLDTDEVRNRLVGTGLHAYGFVRGNAKEPAPTGRDFWQSFVAAVSGRKREERLDDAAWSSANTHEREGCSHAARDLGQARVEIGRRLVLAEPDRLDWRRNHAIAMDRLGCVLVWTGESESARTLLEESLLLRRNLAVAEPDRSEPQEDMTISMMNLSGLLESMGETQTVRSLLEESLDIRRRLVAAEPGQPRRRWAFATSMLGMGRLLVSTGENSKALSLLEECFEILAALVEAEPGQLDWRRDLTTAMESLSDLLASRGEANRSRSLVEESLRIRRELVAAKPCHPYLQLDLTNSMLRLSDLLESTGEASEARKLMEESIEIRRNLVKADPGRLDWKWCLKIAMERLSQLLVDAGETGEAKMLAEGGLTLIRQLVAAEPGRVDWRRDLTVSLDKLSRLLLAVGEREEAATLMEESLRITRQLVATMPDRLDWRRQLAISMTRLSDLLESAGETGRARSLAAESLGFRRDLVAAEPGRLDWRWSLAMSMTRLSDLLESAGEPDRARSLVGESLGIWRDLVAAEPGRLDWRWSLAMSMTRLSDLLESAGETGRARSLAAESLGFRRDLVAAEPGRLDWRWSLAMSMTRLSDLLESAGEPDRARSLVEESLGIWRDLVAAEPGRLDWRWSLAMSMTRLSDLLESAGETGRARSLAAESLGFRRDLVAAEPGRLDWRWSLAMSMTRLSDLLESAGEPDRARSLVEESLGIWRDLVAAEPGRLDWRWSLAMSMTRLSDLLESAGETTRARSLVEESLGIWRDLVAAEPGRLDWRWSLAMSMTRLSDLLESVGEPDRARSLVEESLGIWRDLVAAEPGRLDWRWSLAMSMTRLSDLLESAGETDRAQSLVGESVGIGRDLVAAEPGRLDWRWSLAMSITRLSDLLESAGETTRARSLVEESLGFWRDLVAAEPGRLDWRRSLTISLERLSDLLESAGETERARSLVEESLGITRELVEAEPGRLDWRRDLAISMVKLGDMLLSPGEMEKARSLVGESVGIWRELVGADPGRKDWARDCEVTINRLARLSLMSGEKSQSGALLQEVAAARRQRLAEEWTASGALSLATALGFLAAQRAEVGLYDQATSLIAEAEALLDKLESQKGPALPSRMEREHIRLQRHRTLIRSGCPSPFKDEAVRNLLSLKEQGFRDEKIERLLKEAESLPDDPSEPRALRPVFV